ncbi:Virulence sensor protein BvgS [Mixta intestinalis]|uniref:histidine kinase n=1 Tax=Mixta intestinalis TaxID=1615494 RepID=A0A6P1Q259_9GAMM|nr:Virulence sensor protein BvgS [Mixta intestinalis]
MINRKIYFYFCLFILNFPVFAQPQELTLLINTDLLVPQKEEIRELKNLTYPSLLRVGVPGSARPPVYINMESGKFEGIAADYLGALKKMLGVEIQIISYDTPTEASHALRSNQLDMLAFYNSHIYDSDNVVATTPWLLDYAVIVERDRSASEFNHATQPILAWAEAPGFAPILQRYFPHARLKHFNSVEMALAAVAYGQADAMWGSAASTEFLRRYGYSSLIAAPAELSIADMNLSFGVSTAHPQLAQAIDIALQYIPLAGRQRVVGRWGLDSTFVLKAHPLMLNAEDERWLQENRVISVIPSRGMPPLSIIGHDDQPEGIEIEFLRMISERTGFKFIYGPPSARRDENLLTLYPALLEPETPDANLIYSRPYIVTPWVMVQREHGVTAASLSQLRDKLLAIEESSPMLKWLKHYYPGYKIMQVKNSQQAFNLLVKGEVDAIIQPKLIADYQINNRYLGRLKIVRTVGDQPARFAMATQRENIELIHIINKALLNISRVTQEKIVLRWQNAHHTDTNSYWQYYHGVLVKVALAVGLITLLILLWNRHLQRIIRERTRVEQALKNQLTFSNTLFEESPVVMYVRDRQMRLLHCNKAYVDFLQLPREKLLGSTLQELPEDFEVHESFYAIYEQTFEDGKPMVQDLKLRYQGRDYYTLHWALPYRDHADNIVGIIGGWLDITERYELLTALEKAKEEADRANEFKSRFLANTSHDIRTQLHAIIGLLELEMRRSTRPLGPNITAAYESATALQSLIGNVLDLSKIESGVLQPEPGHTNLVTIVEQLFTLFRSKAKARGLRFRKLITVEDPCVMIDATMFNQIAANLLSNALKFTHSGEVEISLLQQAPRPDEVAQGRYLLRISDTGCGISAHELHKIFDPFVQAGDRVSQQAGTGLGLSICRHLAHLLNGEISVESEPGAGSVFTFSFSAPLSQETPPTVVKPEQPTGAGVRHILILEDHAPNRLLLAQQLKYLGHQVTEAERAAQALEQWEQHKNSFDLIITDCNLPDMDGFTFTRTLRQREEALGLKPIVIVGLTASAETSIQQRCLDAGMNCCLFKPANIETLSSFISTSVPVGAAEPPANSLLDQVAAADPVACGKLIESAIESHRQLAEKLQHCQQHDELTTLAHTLKGGARLLHAVRLEQLCQQLENSQQGDRLLEALCQDVINEVQVLEAQLYARLKALNLP